MNTDSAGKAQICFLQEIAEEAEMNVTANKRSWAIIIFYY
jgi:hypothetical protein